MRLLIPLIILLQAPAGTVSDSALRDALTAKYARKLMTVRGFPTGTRLEFDPAGALTAGATLGVFTLDGHIHIESVNVQQDQVEIRGRQAFLEYNPKTRKLAEYVGSKRMTLQFPRKAGIAVERSIDNALVPFDGLPKLVPGYWEKFLSGAGELRPVVDPVTGVAVPRASQEEGLVPKAVKQTNPEYPEEVESLGISGSTILRVIVDESGKPMVADVVVPIGFGLDRAAIDAVNNWEFEPARKDGKPVKVYIRVRVNFTPPR